MCVFGGDPACFWAGSKKEIICDPLHFERKFKEAACSVPFFQLGVLLWASVTRSFSNYDSFLTSSNNYVSLAGKFDHLSGLLKDRKFYPHSHSSESSFLLLWISLWNHHHFTPSQNYCRIFWSSFAYICICICIFLDRVLFT